MATGALIAGAVGAGPLAKIALATGALTTAVLAIGTFAEETLNAGAAVGAVAVGIGVGRRCHGRLMSRVANRKSATATSAVAASARSSTARRRRERTAGGLRRRPGGGVGAAFTFDSRVCVQEILTGEQDSAFRNATPSGCDVLVSNGAKKLSPQDLGCCNCQSRKSRHHPKGCEARPHCLSGFPFTMPAAIMLSLASPGSVRRACIAVRRPLHGLCPIGSNRP